MNGERAGIELVTVQRSIEFVAWAKASFSADAQAVHVNSSKPVIDVAPQDNRILASPVAAAEQVPFKGSLQGLDIGTPGNPPYMSVQVTATGNATQLGLFTYTELDTVDTSTRIGTGTFVFTAANGDTVFGTISGQATFTPPNVLTIEENAIITGGTGRFAGVTGSFTAARLKNTVTGLTTASFKGTISAPGP